MTNQIKTLTLNFLQWFDTLSTASPISLADVSKFIAPDICFYLNGKLLAEGIDAYLQRLAMLFTHIKQLHIHFPVENLVAANNCSAVNYLETIIHKDGTVSLMVNGMFLHFDENGKISKIFDVFNGSDPVVAHRQ